jgi:hypothetical protein
LYRRLGGPQGRPGRVRKIAPPPGFGADIDKIIILKWIFKNGMGT